MEYTPVNLALDRAHQGEYYQTSLGPYDYWAIEYAYKPIDAKAPEDELPSWRGSPHALRSPPSPTAPTKTPDSAPIPGTWTRRRTGGTWARTL